MHPSRLLTLGLSVLCMVGLLLGCTTREVQASLVKKPEASDHLATSSLPSLETLTGANDRPADRTPMSGLPIFPDPGLLLMAPPGLGERGGAQTSPERRARRMGDVGGDRVLAARGRGWNRGLEWGLGWDSPDRRPGNAGRRGRDR